MAEFKPSYLVHGLPGHPIHPPLTDFTIGAYSFATVAAIISKLGVAEHAFAQAWWLALIVALVSTVLTAAAGLVDWLGITWGSELWRTATVHALANLALVTFPWVTAAGQPQRIPLGERLSASTGR